MIYTEVQVLLNAMGRRRSLRAIGLTGRGKNQNDTRI